MSLNIYEEPKTIDVNTMRNLGPLAALAGVWQGQDGLDVKPKADGPRQQTYVDRIEIQPADPQTNGPQLLYGLRYHQHVVKPGQVKTYHEQVGYWLWEPATQTIFYTLAIPRGVIAMASGKAAPDATQFEVVAHLGSATNGICSNPFLDEAFRTVEFRIKVEVNPDGSWLYHETTVLQIAGQSEPFQHTDSCLLTKIADPEPNPLAKV